MAKITDLSARDQDHWRLHLTWCMRDTPAVNTEARALLRGGELPALDHPAQIHDWLEDPDYRLEVARVWPI